MHSVLLAGATVELSELGPEPAIGPEALMHGYCQELVALIDSSIQFEILAHLEYPRRFWPASWEPYQSSDYRDLIDDVLATPHVRVWCWSSTARGVGVSARRQKYFGGGGRREASRCRSGAMPMTRPRWALGSTEPRTWLRKRGSSPR